MIRNTTNHSLENLIAAMEPGGLEEQEARGQQQLAHDTALPTDGLSTLPPEWGIKVGHEREKDPIFTDVTLPAGWRIVPTNHAMWSDLVDDSGAVRANIFYKAAFYDRCAFIRVA